MAKNNIKNINIEISNPQQATKDEADKQICFILAFVIFSVIIRVSIDEVAETLFIHRETDIHILYSVLNFKLKNL